ncbi:MAG: carbamoyl phosphate synthase small subunit [Eubacteriales bacterium]|nr:carbamoyl phosphate synthase small subunit [Eubacteriales bacterium]
MKAFLILEDGTVFEGNSIGSTKEVISEIVFNTSMIGYMEVLTDPSYAGHAVAMTYPLIGNYGVCYEDMESDKIWPDALIVRELSRIPSNFRSEDTIQHFLEKYEIPGISGIDTRALTRMIRENGTMKGMITTTVYEDLAEPVARIKAHSVSGLVKEASCKESYVMKQAEDFAEPVKKVALLDLGMTRSTAAALCARGCEVTVYPCDTRAETILSSNPDGILLSNGPSDPKENTEIIAEVRRLYESEVPMFAIGMGHLILALAAGADTCKLTYGHHGANYPVKDLESGQAVICTQNHDYAVVPESMDAAKMAAAYVNVNDGTNEGVSYAGKNILSVQFCPDGSQKMQYTGNLYDRFLNMMGGNK